MGFLNKSRLATLAVLLALSVPSLRALDVEAERPQLKVVEVRDKDGQVLSYRHLAGSTDVQMRGTRLAPEARIHLKVGSRPGFVEIDINRGNITGLAPAHRQGRDFLTYVLWAVSVDGRASNLGEITFENEQPVSVNVTTPYQTFWLMVTAEPNFAVVDPSPRVVLYSVGQKTGNDEKRALPIRGDLFYFTHYMTYDSTRGGALERAPNQLLQARKAVELASRSGILAAGTQNGDMKEEQYTRESLTQARTFLARAENAYKKDPTARDVVQFARTAAQSAENARSLAMGAVGGLMVREMENELAKLRKQLAKLHRLEGANASSTEKVVQLTSQPALWFAVAGWAVAIVLLFRRRSI